MAATHTAQHTRVAALLAARWWAAAAHAAPCANTSYAQHLSSLNLVLGVEPGGTAMGRGGPRRSPVVGCRPRSHCRRTWADPRRAACQPLLVLN